MFNRRMLVALIVLLLIFQSLSFSPSGELTAQAQTIPQKKILAIKNTIDSPNYLDNTAFKESGRYEITYMHMKQFVALREELDGKYDIISIGPGTYSTTQVGVKKGNSGAHKTDLIMNDITPTKADEIIKGFIEKGQVVLLHRNFFEQTAASGQTAVLKTKFAPYKSGYSNVLVVDKEVTKEECISWDRRERCTGYKTVVDISQDAQYNTAFATMENYYNTNANALRPRINESSFRGPVDYSKNSTHIYHRGDKLTFDFAIANYEQVNHRKLTGNLYIDANFNKQFEQEELFVTRSLNEAATRLEYELPMGFSGLRYWKLEVVDDQGLKDYMTGVIRFRDHKVEVNVLQITPNGGNDESSLHKVVTNSFFKDDDYQINVTVKSGNEFNRNTAFSEEDMRKYGKSDYLDGKYNMLLFGFRDMYGSTVPLESGTHAGKQILDKFLKTKQSVMFTHDMIFDEATTWLSYQSAFGQGGAKTNLGHSAPIPSQKTMKVNNGLLNAFPFNLKNVEKTFNIVNKRSVSGIEIATTHNQYYSLDLNDQEIIPWYNIIDNGQGDNYRNADPYDSYNHFYTYTKGNITYSGTGHTHKGFPQSEQKLFVNTMFMAYLGANHAPLIEMFTPTDEQPGEHIFTVPSNQKLYVSYQVDDLNLTDYNLYTRIYVDGEQVYPATEGSKAKIRNHSVVSQSLEHGKTDGYVTVRVEVEDEKGAKAETTRYVKVVKADSGLQLNRDVVEESKKEAYTLGQKIPIEYNIVGDTSTQSLTGATGVTPLFILDSELENGVVDIAKQPFSDKPQMLRTFNPDCRPNTKCNNGSLKNYIANGYPTELNIGDTFYAEPGNYIKDFVDAINKRSPLVVPIIEFKNNNQIDITKFVTITPLSTGTCSDKKCEVTIGSYPNLNLRDVRFEETFPVGIEIKVDDITGLLEPKVEQIAGGGYKVTGKLNDFLFTEQNGKFIAPAQKITINITPKQMPAGGTVYQLAPEKSFLTFKNAQKQDKQLNFNHLAIPVELTNFTLEAPSKIAVNQPFDVKVKFPVDAPAGSELIWEYPVDALKRVDGTSPALPVIENPKAASEYLYQLKATSSGTITLIAKLKVPNIDKDDWPSQTVTFSVVDLALTVNCEKPSLLIGETTTCTAELIEDGVVLSGASINWSGLGDSLEFAKSTTATSNPMVVKGIKDGTAMLTATATVGGFTVTQSFELNIESPRVLISPLSTTLRAGEERTFIVSVTSTSSGDPAPTIAVDIGAPNVLELIGVDDKGVQSGKHIFHVRTKAKHTSGNSKTNLTVELETYKGVSVTDSNTSKAIANIEVKSVSGREY